MCYIGTRLLSFSLTVCSYPLLDINLFLGKMLIVLYHDIHYQISDILIYNEQKTDHFSILYDFQSFNALTWKKRRIFWDYVFVISYKI